MKKLSIIPLAIVALSAVACGSHGGKLAMSTPQLTVEVAFDSLVPNVVEFVSQTAPARSYVIQPRVNGYLRSTNFENGMPVRRGQLLFTIDDAPFRTDVAQARAALSSARSSMVEAQAAYNRSVPLAKINAISQSQLDAATATLAAARDGVSSARAVLDNALLNLSYCTIKAPESGIIAPSAANVGDYVGAGTAYETLTTISFDDSVSVNISLPTIEYYRIVSHNLSSGNRDSLLSDITLRLSDGSIYPHRGVYRYTQPLVDNRSGSIVFNVRFPNPQGALRGGQFARVSARVGQPERVVLIPARSVDEIQGTYGAYVLDSGDTLRYRKLTVGRVVDNYWIVRKGVYAGERVITEGLQKAHDGMNVEPIEKSEKTDKNDLR